MADRDHDLVLLGATGFTGALVADHLARRCGPAGLRWAIAGRDLARLEACRERLAAAGEEPAIEVVDVTDLVGLLQLAERTRVLVSTVGPYHQFGELVVQACVRSGTDYADITGESTFVDLLLARYDADARDRGVRIVNCCGFDSIPPDLGARFTVAQLPSDAPMTVRGHVAASGVPSGGTWQSAVRIIGGTSLSDLAGPRPRRAGSRRASSLPPRITHVRELGAWAVPLPTIDAGVVLRSARALQAYGPDFRYGHYARVANPAVLLGGLAGVGLLYGAARFAPTRRLLLELRTSGAGPSAEQRARGWFEVTFLGEAAGERVMTRVAGGDPGYGETAVMLGETALSLAQDDLPEHHGVITTADAFEGGSLQRRLEDQGIVFEVLERN